MTDTDLPEASARRRVPRWLRLVPSVLVLGLLVWLAQDRWSDIEGGQRLPSVTSMVAAVVLSMGGNVLLSMAWREQLRLSGNRLAVGAAVRIWSSSQLSRFLFPGANVGARAVLARKYGVSATASASTTVFEFGWTLLTHPVVVLVTMPFWSSLAWRPAWLWAVAAVPVAGLVALVVVPGPAVRLLAKVLRLVPGVRRRVPGEERLAQVELAPQQALPLAAMYLANGLLRHVAFVLILANVVDLTGNLPLALGAAALGRFVGLIAPFAPGGLGPREGVTVLVLASAVGTTPAIVAVAASRVAELVAEAVVFGLSRRVGHPEAGEAPPLAP